MTSPRRTVENWSELDRDLLSEIADRINCLRDYIIFGAVCRSWRSVASAEKFNKSTKVPWLLLDKDDDYHSPRKFFNLSKDLIYRINLPKSRNSPCHFGNFSIRNGFIYSSKGWLLNVENHLELCLSNPFSLSRITLPHSFLLCSNYILLLNFALSSSPSVASDFVILIVYYSFVTRDVKLGFWKNGDHDWTDIDLIFSTFDSNITYHNGRFYIIRRFEFGAEFVVHEIDIQNSESVSISSKSFANLFPSTHIGSPSWIVGSSQALMIVTWRLDHASIDEDGNIVGDLYSHVPHFEFIVQEIDFEKGECKKWRECWCLQHN
ncbi:uncharacterized protein LOC126680939 isoform X2 [Mercurialis annua]|uniref:uncharacterized protein LOC126680939 isoform X2 n=1 Tax=Mercurialis annua TaxID=3986 RepID=UPI00216019F0|nr:uncharacterized protein LOC126680939 isoform X2 [Mercurialis annua]